MLTVHVHMHVKCVIFSDYVGQGHSHMHEKWEMNTHITFFSSLLKVRLKSENEHVAISYLIFTLVS